MPSYPTVTRLVSWSPEEYVRLDFTGDGFRKMFYSAQCSVRLPTYVSSEVSGDAWRSAARHWSCSAVSRATAALVVATRAAVDRHGPGSCDAPQRAAERRSTEPDDSHQGQGGGGARDERRATATEGSSTGGAAGHPRGARVAEE